MIPKVIHYCWFGENSFGDKEKMCFESWEKFCPDYEIKKWNENNLEPLLDNQYLREAYELEEWAFVSDVVRLYALMTEGGIYMDTDIEVIKPLDHFLELPAFMGFEIDTKVSTGIIGAEKKHPFVKEWYEDYDDRKFIRAEKTEDVETNVIRVSKLLKAKGLELNGEAQTVAGVHVFPQATFSPKNYITREVELTDDTYTIHQFSGSWL